jgi:tripartite ATP-independent transporter DctM subunit
VTDAMSALLGRAGRFGRSVENGVLVLTLAVMVALPVVEIGLRDLLRAGIANAASLVQHLVLVVGMVGAMIAAREGRLLAFSGLESWLPRRLSVWTGRFAAAVALAVTAWLLAASLDFVASEREGKNVLAYGIPAWLVQTVMPFGFAVIGGRIFWRSAPQAAGRMAVLGLAGLFAAPVALGAHGLVPVAAGVILLAAALGAPMFIVLGGLALVLFFGEGLPVAAVPLSHYQLTINPSLPAIPLFTLAGYFLAEGGAPRRLIRLFQALFGGLWGGPAIATVLLAAFFSSFTGASGVTILALGGLLMPLLTGVGYPRRRALGIISSAPALGALLPPAVPLILYAIVARQPIETMFLAGLLPALVMTVAMIAVGVWAAPAAADRPATNWREVRVALAEAKWEVALPVITFASLLSGWTTPSETAAVTAGYAFVVETLIYRDLCLRTDVPRVMVECGLLVGGILLILGMALGLTNYVADAQIPELAAEWVSATIRSPWMFLLILNGLLLVVGMLMDIFSAIIVVTPLIGPVGAAYGLDPVHLGIVFLANMELGFLTPPVGMNLFFASYRFGMPLIEVMRAVLPALAVLGAGVLTITYIPALSTWLPALLR